jgi:hypothetical protein
MGANQPQNQPDKHKQPAQQHQSDIDLDASRSTERRLLEALRTIETQAKAQAEEEYANNESWYSPTVLPQISLCVIGVLYTFFAALQWWAIRQSLRVSERAYISVRPMEIIDFREGMKPAILLTIQNEGNTPAYNVRCWSAIATVTAPFPKKFPQASLGPECTLIQKANFVLNPRLTNNLSRTDVAALSIAQQRRLFVWGRVEYRDAFGKLRFITFRSFVRDDPPNAYPDEEGNDAN